MFTSSRSAFNKIIKIFIYFINKYQLKTIFKLLLYLIFIWIIGSTWLYITEKNYTLSSAEIAQGQLNYFDSYFDSFRNNLVYIFSGFEEYVPHTTAGWIGSIFVMLFGSLGVLALLIGNVNSIIHERSEKSQFIPPLPDYKNLSDHVVICNWNEKGYEIIGQQHNKIIDNHKIIVIISENADQILMLHSLFPKRVFKNVFSIKGDPTDKKIIEKAAIYNADTVIILAEENNDLNTLSQQNLTNSNIQNIYSTSINHKLSDAKTILTGMIVEALNPKVHTITELLHKKNKIHLERTHIDEIISTKNITAGLISQTVLNHGLTKFYSNLLTTSNDTNEIYIIDLPKHLQNKTYHEIRDIIYSSGLNIILIGFATPKPKTINGQQVKNFEGKPIIEKRFIINPLKDTKNNYNINYKLSNKDSLIFIAYKKPNLKKI